MRIAVFGSRDGVPREAVVEYLEPRFDARVVLVSGGARGVDEFAETYWRGRGGRVLSIRPTKLQDGTYAVEYWDHEKVWVPTEWPTFEDFKSCAIFRDMVIAHEADRGVAFQANKSRGTGGTIGHFYREGKPCAVHSF